MAPTIREIAAAAGVHHTTLSRALRGLPGVSADRAQELCALAKQMGYVPDPMLSALAAYRVSRRPAAFHSVIVYFNPTTCRQDASRYKSYSGFLRSATQRAAQKGFRLELMTLQKNMSRQRMTAMLRARNVTGILVGPVDYGGLVLDALDWSEFSAVRLGQSVASPQLHAVSPDRFKSMDLLMDELIARGYRRPGLLIEARMDRNVEMQWSAGFLRHQLRLRVRDRLPLFMPDTGESIIPAAPQWVRQYRPDVIVVVGSEKLPGVLAKEGWSIPRDLGLAVLVQPNHGPLMSGLDERNEEIGAAAVDFLIGMMNRQERGVPASPQTLMINSGWIDGGTLRPRG